MRRIARLLGVLTFLEVTVEGDSSLDLSEFDEATHAGVLLDGVADATVLAANREVLQGRPKASTGGRSATMVYAYQYALCRRAVVVTMDLAAANLAFFDTHRWLGARANAIVLRLTEPAWVVAP